MLGSSPQQEGGIKDFLLLECSLFRLTKKCSKLCLTKMMQITEVNEAIDIYEGINQNMDMNKSYNECLKDCAIQYVISRNAVKLKYMNDLSRVMEENQKIFDSYYNRDAKKN